MNVVVRGPLDARPFVFQRQEIAPGRIAPLAAYMFDGVRARDVAFDLTEAHLTVQNSTFEACRFSQERRPAPDGSWGQGSLGRRPAMYRDCEFVGVRFRVRAGYSVGQAAFERCAFRRCDFGEHFSWCADYIDCVFDGPIRRAVFYGRAPKGHRCDGKTNLVRGNDFTRAVFGDVGFRGSVALEDQIWPHGFDPATLVDEV